MKTIGQYSIKESNASRHYQSSLKIERQGVIIAHIKADHGKLLTHVRKWYHSPERAEIIRQLSLAKVSENDIEMLLKIDAKIA